MIAGTQVMPYASDVARFGLATFFIISAATKLRDLRQFRETLAALDWLPTKAVTPLAVGVPLAECIGAVSILVVPLLGDIMMILLLTAFAFAAEITFRSGRQVRCSCFGTLSESTLGRNTVYRNALLIAVAIAVLIQTSTGFQDALPEALLGVVAALAAVVWTETLPDALRGIDEVVGLIEANERTDA
jgi:hypothetical protein